jgi:CDGSH-type Zn-finger protein
MTGDGVTIIPTVNGPYEVTGAVDIVSPDGRVLRETAKAYLCRCGHSASKPFCDGSHRRAGWTEG